MYCGNCFRDNALVAELRRQGHETLMLPLYLPMTLDEPNQSAGTPLFFGGINVYLEQQSALFRHTPDWLRNLLNHPKLLKLAAGRAAKTRAADLGELTLSMLQGEQGHQARELDELLGWLKPQGAPEAVFLSNALLLGLARRLKRELGTRVICMLQGEDEFLDGLPEPFKTRCWDEVRLRAREIDHFIAPSRYFGDLMADRAHIPSDRLSVIYNGISLEGYPDQSPAANVRAPVLGFFARLCPDKGLDLLVEAYLEARKALPGLRLKIGGACGPADELFVAECRRKLADANAASDVEFHTNLDRAAKIGFLKSLSLLCVPARYREAFGLYVLEAMAAGTPVVQPRHAAFPELVEATGGGLIVDHDPKALARGIVEVAADTELQRRLSQQAHAGVRTHFTAARMAEQVVQLVKRLPAPLA